MDLADLNEEQRQAVESEGHTLVSACPGSGKTRVLITRAEYLIRQDPQNRVIAVTFNSEAATEMLQRMNALGLPQEQRRRFDAGTFHALALRQLKEAGLVRKNSLLNAGEWIAILKSALERALNDGADLADYSYDDLSLKIQGLQVEETEPAQTGPDDPIPYLYQLFSQQKKQSGKIDFADLIRMALNGMKDGSIAPLPCTHLLADEAQDMDWLQHAWLRAMMRTSKNPQGAWITLVGDDDQSIYGWRHAQGYGGMKRFENVAEAQHVTLPVNYRCAPEILEHCRMLIHKNPERVEKSIRAALPPGGTIEMMELPKMGEYELIDQWLFDSDKETSIAFITRTNQRLNDMQRLLQETGHPYIRVGGGSFLDDVDVASVHRLLQALALDQTKPAEALKHMRQVLTWGGLPHRLVQEHIASATRPSELVDVLLQQDMPPGMHMPWSLLEKLQKLFQQAPAQLSKNRNSLAIHLAASIAQPHAHDKKQGGKRIESLARILEKTETRSRLITRLNRLEMQLRNKDDSPPNKDNPPRVTLLTAHASKGREFDRVLIGGATNEAFPNKDSPIEEERRLMYVAMTRAREHLVVSADPEKPFSPFIAESGLVAQ